MIVNVVTEMRKIIAIASLFFTVKMLAIPLKFVIEFQNIRF